jgi:hypothetical protein
MYPMLLLGIRFSPSSLLASTTSTIFAGLMADGLELPDGVLVVGPEIARGANGVVHEATLYGGPVCAKVCHCYAAALAERTERVTAVVVRVDCAVDAVIAHAV